MARKLGAFQYQSDNFKNKLTSFAGLPLYCELAVVCGLTDVIEKTMNSKSQGWDDLEIIMAIILLNLAGGDCVEDIEHLEADQGLCAIIHQINTHGMTKKQRSVYQNRWRKSKSRTLPSMSVIRRYLEQFHNGNEEAKRVKGQAFIPAHNEQLQNLLEINSCLTNFAQSKNPVDVATLDQDATLSATAKRNSLYCYKKFKAYQPFNTYWAEQKMLVHSEFRDGNVNAGLDQLRLLKESTKILPMSIKKVKLRSDSAAYQREVLDYCAEGKDERFGVIEFAISADVNPAFKKAVKEVDERDWNTIYKSDGKALYKTSQEYAEVCFVPGWVAKSKKQAKYRYLAIREPMVESKKSDSELEDLPFQTMDMVKQKYKLFGIVTNSPLEGNDLITWFRQRCGYSEEVHSIQKSELAGGQFPSGKFGANAAWWQVMILAFNLNALMKHLVLPEGLKTKGMKALRFHLIGVCGRIVSHARKWSIKLGGGHAVSELFVKAQKNIAALMNPLGPEAGCG